MKGLLPLLRSPKSLFGLAVLFSLAQGVPFLVSSVWPVSVPSSQMKALQDLNLSVDYTEQDVAMAVSYVRPLAWADLIGLMVPVLGYMALLSTKLPEGFEALSSNPLGKWLARIAFAILLFLWLYILTFTRSFCGYWHARSFDMTPLGLPEWAGIVLLKNAYPMVLYVLKCLLIFCLMALLGRRWWLGSALAIFLLTDAIPEMVARTQPVDLVEKVKPLEEGPFAERFLEVSQRVGIHMDLKMVDQSRRSKSAIAYVTGPAGRRYAVLSDVFVQNFTPEDAVVVLAHELGHEKRAGVFLVANKGMALFGLIVGFAAAFLLSHRERIPESTRLRTVALALMCALCATKILLPVSNAISRAEETLADRACLEVIKDKRAFQEVVVKTAKHNLQPLDEPVWEHVLFSTHPTGVQRIR